MLIFYRIKLSVHYKHLSCYKVQATLKPQRAMAQMRGVYQQAFQIILCSSNDPLNLTKNMGINIYIFFLIVLLKKKQKKKKEKEKKGKDRLREINILLLYINVCFFLLYKFIWGKKK